MKNILMVVCLWLSMHQIAPAATYYVASGGDDLSDGLTPLSAFQTVDKINQLSLLPGDSVLFNRGDRFRGMLLIQYSGSATEPVYIGAFGTGPKPVISGAESITGWTKASSQIYTAACTDCPDRLKQIFIHGKRHIPARYPNSGYFSMTNVTPSSFSAVSLTDPAGTWDSADVYLRTFSWVIDRFKVTSYTPGQINYEIPSHFYTSYPIQEHYGFFLTGKYSALDSAGEWYYDKSSKKIFLIPTDTASLVSNGAEVSVYMNCIRFNNGVKYVLVRDLQLEKSLDDAVYLNQTLFITIDGCTIIQAGRDGIGGFEDYATYNASFTVRDCIVKDICNTGINFTGGEKILIENNSIASCGLIPGMGEGYDSGYEGIYCPSDSRVLRNTIDSTGYIGIHVASRDSVLYNRVNHYSLTKNDCGGIYFYSGADNYIGYNFTGDGYGNGEGTNYANGTMVHGIYLDEFSQNNIIEFNTSYHNESGIMLHKTASSILRNNVCYDNRRAQLIILEEGATASPTVHDNQIRGNIFQCLHPSQRCMYVLTNKNNVSTLASLDNNWYCNPYEDEMIDIDYVPKYNEGNTTHRYQNLALNEWKTQYGFDTLSHTAYDFPSTYAEYTPTGPNLILNSDFSPGTGWWYAYGNTDFSLVSDASDNRMNGPSLKGHYADTGVLMPGNIGVGSIPVKKDRQYLLSYRIAGNASGGLQVNINQASAPYIRSIDPAVMDKSFSLAARNDSLLFSGSLSGDCSLTFKSSSEDGDLWLDDVYLFEVHADTTISTPHLVTPLFQNPSGMPVTLKTAGKYRSLDGNMLSSDLILPPYSSIVFKRAEVKVTEIKNGSNEERLQVFPNPVSDVLKIKMPGKMMCSDTKIFVTDIQGKELLRVTRIGETISVPAEWTNGVYLIVIMNSESKYISKFVLSR